MSLSLLLSLASLTATPGERVEPTVLIFEFPDGARGGIGKIDGLGLFVPGQDWNPTERLKRCGLKQPKIYLPTHKFYVYGLSTPKDMEIVRCFQRLTYNHFTVGRGRVSLRLGGYPEITDERSFRSFWRMSAGKPK